MAALHLNLIRWDFRGVIANRTANRRALKDLYSHLHSGCDRSEDDLIAAVDYGLRVLAHDDARHQSTLAEADRLARNGEADKATLLIRALCRSDISEPGPPLA